MAHSVHMAPRTNVVHTNQSSLQFITLQFFYSLQSLHRCQKKDSAKKMLDDIFFATRFTKVPEAIRKLKNDQNQQIKVPMRSRNYKKARNEKIQKGLFSTAHHSQIRPET